MDQLNINSFICSAPGCIGPFYGTARFLGVIDAEAFLIRMDVKTLKHIIPPRIIQMDLLTQAIEKGDILTDQQFDTNIPVSEECLSEPARKQWQVNLEIIRPLIYIENNLGIFKTDQIAIFSERAKKLNVSVSTVRRMLLRYYWGGESELALAPFYFRRGSIGRLQMSDDGRRGPKVKTILSDDYGNPILPSETPLQSVREQMQKGLRRFFFSRKTTVRKAYNHTLNHFFSTDCVAKKLCNGAIELHYIRKPSNQLPSLAQFENQLKLMQAKVGPRTNYTRLTRNKKITELPRGTARDGVLGPGYRFEIDASTYQAQLISRYGAERLIGCPNFYAIVDVWSGAFVGYAFGIENVGWPFAAKALRNCFTDKGKIFRRLNLPYDSSAWPCRHLPSRLSGDHGELIGIKAESTSSIGIKLEIVAVRRPECKGLVEVGFSRIKHDDFIEVPGSFPKFPKRLEPNGKNTARLTIYDLERVLVEQMLSLNQRTLSKDLVPVEMHKEHNPELTYIGKWKWGLLNRPGFTRQSTEDEIVSQLMTKDVGTVTNMGISYKGKTYFSERLSKNGYITRAHTSGSFKIPIRLDELIAEEIYFLDESTTPPQAAKTNAPRELNTWSLALVNDEDLRERNYSFYELDIYNRYLNKSLEETKNKEMTNRIATTQRIKKDVKEAQKKAMKDRASSDIRTSKPNIRENRNFEREAERLTSDQRNDPVELDKILGSASVENSSNEITSTDAITQLSRELWIKSTKKRNNDAPLDK